MLHILQHGGFFLYTILGVGFAVLVISIERFLTYRFRYQIRAAEFFNELKKFLTQGDLKRAREWCRQSEGVPLANVLGAGLAHVDQGADDIDQAMESETLHFVPLINKRLNFVAGLANVSTLLGLTGTITGLIMSFAALGGKVGMGAGKAEALSAGIAESMYATAFGLFVAVPAVLIHMYLSSKASRLIDELDNYSAKLARLLRRANRKRSVDVHRHEAAPAREENSAKVVAKRA